MWKKGGVGVAGALTAVNARRGPNQLTGVFTRRGNLDTEEASRELCTEKGGDTSRKQPSAS